MEEDQSMSKSNGKSNPASEVGKLEAAIIAAEIRLSNTATELKELSKNTSISASEFVRARNRLSGEISDLREEIKVLEEWLDAARLGDAKRAHEMKVNSASLTLRRRLAHMEVLDEALERAAEAARAISRIDVEELAGDIAGIDARFDLLRKQWVHVAINRLASLGLGNDRRLDRSVPVPTMADYSAAQHKVILSELADKAPTSADIPPAAPSDPAPSPSAPSSAPQPATPSPKPRGKSARYIEVEAA
jgi:hypothetical protein